MSGEIAMRKTFGFAVALLLAPLCANAGIDKAGTTAANFLSIGSGADVLGMGGATLGGGFGLNAAAWNVAALSGLRGTEYVFSHASLTGESPQDWVAAGGRFGASRSRWGVTALYQGDGSFEGRDASNNPTGSFTASSMALGAQFAQPVGPASLGVGVKYVSEKLGSVSGGGIAVDAGIQLQAGPIGFGAAAQNAFGKMSYGGATYDFPANYGLGVAYRIPLTGLSFALDANFPTAYYSDVRAGFEWRYRERVALRSGYRKEISAAPGEPMGGPTFGMGAGANGFWIDYSFLTGGSTGSGQHRVGLTYHPGVMNGDADKDSPDALRPARPAPTVKLVPEPAPAQVTKPAKASAPAPSATEASPVAPSSNSRTEVAPASAAPQAITPKPEVAGNATQAPAPTNVKPAVQPAPNRSVALATKPSVAPATSSSQPPAVAPAPSAPNPTVVPAPSASEPPAVAPSKPAVVTPPVAAAPAPKPVAPVVANSQPAPAPAASSAPPPPRPTRVRVGSGDSMAAIAKRWGVTTAAIMMENNLVSERVKPGQVLKLPPAPR
jgi:LysM repeat protein